MAAPLRITIIGTGYLGAVHAACMTELGHDVLGVDIRPDQVRALAAGTAPFHEPGLDELLRRGLDSGRLGFTTSYEDAARFGDAHFICAGTPQLGASGQPDMSQVDGCVAALVPLLGRPCLIAGKSTVPPGTTARLSASLPAGVEMAWNPEFLREGHAITDTLQPDRIVAGVTSERATDLLREVYAPVLAAGIPFLVTSPETAELAKLAANAYLAAKISFINVIADICEVTGADAGGVSRVLGHDDRIGHRGLIPGLGFGGGCLPKDLRALIACGTEMGVPMGMLRAARDINTGRRYRVVVATKHLAGGSLDGVSVAVLGAAFKPLTDDVRDSPALAVAVALHSAGAKVRVTDPEALGNAERAAPQLSYCPEVEKAAADADVVLHLTDWPQFREIDPAELGEVVRRKVILDARSALPLDQWRAAGWTAEAMGNGEPCGS